MASITRRSPKEIEADFQRIKDAAKKATSIADIEKFTQLSRTQILTSLEKHPILAKRIKEQLLNNKTFAENYTAKTEVKTVENETISSPKVKETILSPTTESSDKNSNSVKKYVIDASITATVNLREQLENICASNHKIILTSITIKELERLQPFRDVTGNDARYILNLAVDNPDNFESVLIDETIGIPDDCIIHYCNQHKDSVILLTADKGMTLKARMYAINVEYFKKVWAQTSNNEQPTTAASSNTLYLNKTPQTASTQLVTKNTSNNNPVVTKVRHSPFNAEKNAYDQLVINEFHMPKKSICVHSRGEQFDKGPCKLHVGDSVFVATLEEDNVIDFKVYLIISLSSIDNNKLIFKKKFYPDKRISLTDGRYRSFVYGFKRRHNV